MSQSFVNEIPYSRGRKGEHLLRKAVTPRKQATRRRRKSTIDISRISEHTKKRIADKSPPTIMKPVKLFKNTVKLNDQGKAIFWRMEETKAFSIFPRPFTVAVLRELQRKYGDPDQKPFGT